MEGKPRKIPDDAPLSPHIKIDDWYGLAIKMASQACYDREDVYDVAMDALIRAAQSYQPHPEYGAVGFDRWLGYYIRNETVRRIRHRRKSIRDLHRGRVEQRPDRGDLARIVELEEGRESARKIVDHAGITESELLAVEMVCRTGNQKRASLGLHRNKSRVCELIRVFNFKIQRQSRP